MGGCCAGAWALPGGNTCNLLSGKAHFCVGLVFFLFPDSTSAHGTAGGSCAGGGTARSLCSTRRSGARQDSPVPSLFNARWPSAILRAPHRPGAFPGSMGPAQPLEAPPPGWAGVAGGWGGGRAEEWEDGAVDKAPATKPVWDRVIWHSVGSCS